MDISLFVYKVEDVLFFGWLADRLIHLHLDLGLVIRIRVYVFFIGGKLSGLGFLGNSGAD